MLVSSSKWLIQFARVSTEQLMLPLLLGERRQRPRRTFYWENFKLVHLSFDLCSGLPRNILCTWLLCFPNKHDWAWQFSFLYETRFLLHERMNSESFNEIFYYLYSRLALCPYFWLLNIDVPLVLIGIYNNGIFFVHLQNLT